MSVIPENLRRLKLDSLQASMYIKSGMNVAMGGYSGAGYPKATVVALKQRKTDGEDLRISLLTGANVPFIDEHLAQLDMIERRIPMVAHKTLSVLVNKGHTHYVEQQMNRMPHLLHRDAFGSIDVLVLEALGFDKDGYLIPTNAIGMLDILIMKASKIIIEINSGQPKKLALLHDIYSPQKAPYTAPIPLLMVNQRIGLKGIPFDHEKIVAIVETNIQEESTTLFQTNEITESLAQNLFNFLEIEYASRGGTLPPIQTGFGAIADSIAIGLEKSNFKNLEFFCGGVGESIIRLIEKGKATSVSTGGLGMNEYVSSFINSHPNIEHSLVIRNGSITNSSEIINRLSLIAINTGIEVDIYGNVNSSHINGTRVVNGIGGGANFAQNSGLSIILIPSSSKQDTISHIVPMVSHQDISGHDIDIIISEHGVADIRGLDDREIATTIINNCAALPYRPLLKRYLYEAISTVGGHHPQLPLEAYRWHQRLQESGSMLMEDK